MADQADFGVLTTDHCPLILGRWQRFQRGGEEFVKKKRKEGVRRGEKRGVYRLVRGRLRIRLSILPCFAPNGARVAKRGGGKKSCAGGEKEGRKVVRHDVPLCPFLPCRTWPLSWRATLKEKKRGEGKGRTSSGGKEKRSGLPKSSRQSLILVALLLLSYFITFRPYHADSNGGKGEGKKKRLSQKKGRERSRCRADRPHS